PGECASHCATRGKNHFSRHLPNPGLLNLAVWYEEAITHCLHEQLDALTMFTPEEVTRMFVPPSPTSPAQRKKLTAAAQALEHLGVVGSSCAKGSKARGSI